MLRHWGQVTHICVDNLIMIGSDNGLSPGWRQAIFWTSAGILLIGPLGTTFSETSTGIQAFSFKRMHLKMSSAKWRLFRLGLNVLNKKMFYRGPEVIYPLIYLLLSHSPSHNDSTLYIEIYNCIGILLSVLIQHYVCWWSGADKHQIIFRHYVDIYHSVDIPLFKTNPNTTLNGNLCILSARLTTREKKNCRVRGFC